MLLVYQIEESCQVARSVGVVIWMMQPRLCGSSSSRTRWIFEMCTSTPSGSTGRRAWQSGMRSWVVLLLTAWSWCKVELGQSLGRVVAGHLASKAHEIPFGRKHSWWRILCACHKSSVHIVHFPLSPCSVSSYRAWLLNAILCRSLAHRAATARTHNQRTSLTMKVFISPSGTTIVMIALERSCCRCRAQFPEPQAHPRKAANNLQIP